VALTKFRTAQPFGPYVHQGNNLDAEKAQVEFYVHDLRLY
jgi:hypothetical protein